MLPPMSLLVLGYCMMPEALIWGASGGIGSALVDLLLERDWQVYAAARTVSHIPDGVEASYEFDARSPETIEQTGMFVAQQSDGIDLMVYAAGDLVFDKLDGVDVSGWHATIDSNLTGAFYTARVTLPLLKPGGHMVFIGAYPDHVQIPKMGPYAVAKAGLDSLVAVLTRENRRQRFTLLRPGPVDTAFWEQVSFKLPADAKAPSVVAKAVLDRHESGESGYLDL